MPNSLALGSIDADVFNQKVAAMTKPALGTELFGSVSLDGSDFIAEYIVPTSTIVSYLILAWLGYCCCMKRNLFRRNPTSRSQEGYHTFLLIPSLPVAFCAGSKLRSVYFSGARPIVAIVSMVLVLVSTIVASNLLIQHLVDTRPLKMTTKKQWVPSPLWKKICASLHAGLLGGLILATRTFLFTSLQEWIVWSLIHALFAIEIAANSTDVVPVVLTKLFRVVFPCNEGRCYVRFMFRHFGAALDEMRRAGTPLKLLGSMLEEARERGGRRARSITVKHVRDAGYSESASAFRCAGFRLRDMAHAFTLEELLEAKFDRSAIRKAQKRRNTFSDDEATTRTEKKKEK